MPPRQSSSWLWPGHGLGPVNVDVPVVSGKMTGMVPAGVPGGGQSEETVNIWLPGALPTTTSPSVRHAWPCRGPLSQVPALPMSLPEQRGQSRFGEERNTSDSRRSEEHTSELQSHHDLVCRLLLEKKNILQLTTTKP